MSDTYVPPTAPTPHPGQPAPAPSAGRNGLATAGFVLGLLGFLGAWIPLLNIVGMLLGVLGAVLAAVGLAKSKKAKAGKGLAIAGLMLGVIAVIVAMVINAAFVATVDEATDTKVEAPAAASGKKAAADDLGTTRANPAPLGSKITGDDWTVTINSVKAAKADSYGEKAAAGSVLLVINLTATYTGKDEQGESAWTSVKFVTPDGKTVDSTDSDSMFIPKKQFDTLKTVYSGGSVRGNTILEVPAGNWKDGVLAVSPSMLSDDTFVAVK